DEYAYMSLALAQTANGQFADAEANYKKALELDPRNPDVLHGYSSLLNDTGYLQQSLEIRQKLRELDPFVPVYNWVTSLVMSGAGFTDEAIALLEKMPADRLGRQFYLSRLYAAKGRYVDAANTLEHVSFEFGAASVLAEAVRLLRIAPAAVRSPDTLPQLGILG